MNSYNAKRFTLSLLLLSPFCTGLMAHAADKTNIAKEEIPFKSVEDALTTLKKTPAVIFLTEHPQGWTLATETPSEHIKTMWSFPPKGHYAYPAVVRKIDTQTESGTATDTTVLCETAKAPCHRLLQEFGKLSQQLYKTTNKAEPSTQENQHNDGK